MNFIETIKVTEEKFAPFKRKDLLLEGRKYGLFALPRPGYLLQCLVTKIIRPIVIEKCMHDEWIFSTKRWFYHKGFYLSSKNCFRGNNTLFRGNGE